MKARTGGERGGPKVPWRAVDVPAEKPSTACDQEKDSLEKRQSRIVANYVREEGSEGGFSFAPPTGGRGLKNQRKNGREACYARGGRKGKDVGAARGKGKRKGVGSAVVEG